MALSGRAQVSTAAVETFPLLIQFPSPNTALLDGRPENFYQPTISKRAISGMYGFVRSSEPEPARYFNLFHEGIDIKPLQFDAKGEPKDQVFAAAAGEVVYANTRASQSNYGLYLILRHRYGPHDLYTTYGHLAAVQVEAGDKVKAGQIIGKLGWSGNVGTRDRAHLHFETGFLVNKDYSGWYRNVGIGFEPYPTPNEHGNFSGLNFLGVDPSRLLLDSAQNKTITVPGIFASLKPLFRVRIPAAKDYFDWQKRFPEQVEGGLGLPQPASWEVECTRTGMPLSFKRSAEPCDRPELLWFDDSLSLQESFNRGLIQKVQGKRSLSRHGLKWFSQLMWQD